MAGKDGVAFGNLVRELNRLWSLSELAPFALERITALLSLRRAALVVQEWPEEAYRVCATVGLPPAALEVRFAPAGEVVRCLQRAVLLDLEEERGWPAEEQAALESLSGRFLVPLRQEGELLGWLHLGAEAAPWCTERDRSLLSLADALAMALACAIRSARYRDEVRALEALNRIGLAATRRELDDLLMQIYQEVACLVDASNFYIAFYDEQAQEFSFAFYIKDGVRHRPEEGDRWPLGEGLTSDIVRTQAPVVAADYIAECERRGIRPRGKERGVPGMSWVGMPLLAGDRVIGVMCVYSLVPGTVYRAEHVRLLSTVAAQIAVVIERARSREREQRRVAELEMLGQIGRAIGSAVGLEELLQIIGQGVQRMLAAPNFYIALYDRERDEFSFALYLEGGRPAEPPIQSWPSQQGLSGEILRSGQPLLTDDYLAECERRGIAPGGRPGKAWLGVPIRVENELVGVMVASSFGEEARYDQNDLRLLSTIATQAASAIQNARLYRASTRRSEQLTALFEVGQALVSTLDLREVLDTICREAVRLLGATSAYVCDWLAEEQVSRVIAEYIGPEANPLERVSDVGEAYTGEMLAGILEEGRPRVVYLDDLALCPDERTYIEQFGGNTILYLPLLSRGRPLGYVEVWESRYRREFTPDELLLGQSLASQAAVAIENARLYAQTDAALARRVEELTALEAIARELNTSLDLQRVLDTVLDRAMGATRATAGVIAMLTPDEQGLLLLSFRGYPEEICRYYQRHPWPLGEGIIGRVVRTDEPVLLGDVRHSPDYAEVRTESLSEVAVPIRYLGKTIGVINLESERQAAFDQEHLRFLQQLAEHAAVAIRNAREYQAQVRQTELLRRRTEQLAELLRVGNAMRAQLDLTGVLWVVAEGVRRSLGYNTALLSLVDRENPGFLRRVACAGLSPEAFAPLQATPVPREQYDRLRRPEFRLGAAYFIDHRVANFASLWDSPVPTHRLDLGERLEGEWHPDDVLFIPLLGMGGDLLGILSVDDPVDRQLPTLEVAEVLELFAHQATIAIENARLFQEVTEARDRLQAILDSTHDGIAMLDESGLILLANPPVARWSGLAQDEMVGLPMRELILRVSRGNRKVRRTLIAEWRRARPLLLQNPQAVLQGEFEVELEPEPARSFEWLLLPVLERQGNLLGRVLVLRDVSEQRAAERMREDLISMMVHDLRGPLSALLGSLETLLRVEAGPLNETQRTLVELARDGGRQMLLLVNRLLDIRRLEAGRMPLTFVPLHLEEVVRRVVARLSSLTRERRLTVRVHLAPDLPPVRGDREQVERIFENLLHNAIKFSYPGGMIRVWVRHLAEEDCVLCAVVDYGVGIPRGELERVFEKFAQVHRGGGPRGSGLGLAFCRLAVEAHGGRIWVESEEGRGSRFFFTLPLWEGSS